MDYTTDHSRAYLLGFRSAARDIAQDKKDKTAGERPHRVADRTVYLATLPLNLFRGYGHGYFAGLLTAWGR